MSVFLSAFYYNRKRRLCQAAIFIRRAPFAAARVYS
jgi:hypothetical protein